MELVRCADTVPGSAQARARAQERSVPHEPKPALYTSPPRMLAAHRGAQRRLARQLREAALRATPAELQELDRLERLVRIEAITVFEAQRILTSVISQQRGRGDQRAA